MRVDAFKPWWGRLSETRWFDRWLDLRARLVADPRFHRFAARFPLTRPTANRHARALFDLCAGFVYSQALLACVRLRLMDHLADGPLSDAELARRMELAPLAAQRLISAAVSLGLARRRRGGRVGLGDLGAAFLAAPGVREMVEHHALLYADLADPVALLRADPGDPARADDAADPAENPRLNSYWAYKSAENPAALDAETVASYSALMGASQPFVAEEVLSAYAFAGHRRLLDVGGGEGVFLSAVAARWPHLELTLFDLPAVAERARAQAASNGLSDRLTCVGGSFFDDPLPEGADAVSLVRVLYDHDDAAALTILRAARRAIRPGGRLIVAEPMADTPGAEPIGGAYFGFYLLAMGGGPSRSPADLAQLIEAAGFARPSLRPSPRPLLTRVLVAAPA